MNFKPDAVSEGFIPISVEKFVDLFKENNPDMNAEDIKINLKHFKKLKIKGQKCDCGNPIWIVGSAIAGQGCFTCLTGETDNSKDYEIK